MARSGSVDPLEKFRFRVTWSSAPGESPVVAPTMGFHDVQMPKRSTNKIAYRTGEDADIMTQSAGLSSMEDIVMSQGLVSGSSGSEMYKWMAAVHSPSAGKSGDTDTRKAGGITQIAGSASHAYRKDVTVSMLDREGTVVRVWKLYQAWPVNFVPGSDLNASEDGDKSLQQLTLAYEDFQEVIASDSNTAIATV